MNSERRLTLLSEVSPEPIEWLWPDRVPVAALTLLLGDPGQGKSLLTYSLTACVTTGASLPGCESVAAPAAGVVLLQAEDSLRGTIRPNLEAAGADLARVYVHDRSRFADEPLALPQDLAVVEAAAAAVQARLVVLDPFSAFLSASANSEQRVRGALRPLTAFAERAGTAIVLVGHPSKSHPSNPLYCGSGSIGVIAAVRSALMVGPDPSSADPYRHVLAQLKTNLSSATSLSYRTVMRGGSLVVEWLGECSATARDLAGAGRGDHSALSEAVQVLRAILADGPVEASEVFRLAAKAGTSKRTLDRAKKALGVDRWKRGSERGSSWLWALPGDERSLAPPEGVDVNNLSHLRAIRQRQQAAGLRVVRLPS